MKPLLKALLPSLWLALFVGVCLAGALGANGRGIMALSALLYLALMGM